MATFVPSRRNPEATSIGAVTGAVAATSRPGSYYESPEGFLGLNWRGIGISVFVAVVTSVATDIAITKWHAYRKRI